MRILMLSAEYPPLQGGVGDYTVKLAQALVERQINVTVLTGISEHDDGLAFPVWRRVRGWGRTLAKDIRQAIQDSHADILHIQYQTGAYGMKSAVNLLPNSVNIPTVVTFHDLRMPYLAPKVAPLRRYVTRLLLERAASVIVTNAEDEARLAGDAPVDDPDVYSLSKALHPPPHLIPIGANIEVCLIQDRAIVRQQAQLPVDAQIITYFGLLNASKGVQTIIEALPYLPEHVHLLIIGGGTSTPSDEEYAEAIQATIERLNLSARIHWTGFLAACDVSAMLQISDVCVLPFADGASYRRGSLLAALAHGIPVVTSTPRVPLEPALRHEREVFFAPADEPISLALAIEQVLANTALQQTLSAAGPRIMQAFRWETIATQHEALYRGIVDSKQ